MPGDVMSPAKEDGKEPSSSAQQNEQNANSISVILSPQGCLDDRLDQVRRRERKRLSSNVNSHHPTEG